VDVPVRQDGGRRRRRNPRHPDILHPDRVLRSHVNRRR
jgi:hypothetical protein